jgi:hypothetical protein
VRGHFALGECAAAPQRKPSAVDFFDNLANDRLLCERTFLVARLAKSGRMGHYQRIKYRFGSPTFQPGLTLALDSSNDPLRKFDLAAEVRRKNLRPERDDLWNPVL